MSISATTLPSLTRSPSAAAIASGSLDVPPSIVLTGKVSSPSSRVAARPNGVSAAWVWVLPKFASNMVRVRSCIMPRLEGHAQIHGHSGQPQGGIGDAVVDEQFAHRDIVGSELRGQPVVQVFQRIEPRQQAHAHHERRQFAFVVGHPVDGGIGPFARPHPCSFHVVGHGQQAADVREEPDVKPGAQVDGPRIRAPHLAGAVFRARLHAIGRMGPSAGAVRPFQQDHIDAEIRKQQRAVEPRQAAPDHHGRGLFGGEARCRLEQRVGKGQGRQRERSLEDLSSSHTHFSSSKGVAADWLPVRILTVGVVSRP